MVTVSKTGKKVSRVSGPKQDQYNVESEGMNYPTANPEFRPSTDPNRKITNFDQPNNRVKVSAGGQTFDLSKEEYGGQFVTPKTMQLDQILAGQKEQAAQEGYKKEGAEAEKMNLAKAEGAAGVQREAGLLPPVQENQAQAQNPAQLEAQGQPPAAPMGQNIPPTQAVPTAPVQTAQTPTEQTPTEQPETAVNDTSTVDYFFASRVFQPLGITGFDSVKVALEDPKRAAKWAAVETAIGTAIGFAPNYLYGLAAKAHGWKSVEAAIKFGWTPSSSEMIWHGVKTLATLSVAGGVGSSMIGAFLVGARSMAGLATGDMGDLARQVEKGEKTYEQAISDYETDVVSFNNARRYVKYAMSVPLLKSMAKGLGTATYFEIEQRNIDSGLYRQRIEQARLQASVNQNKAIYGR
jgi:hypothetical protein